MHGRRRMMMHVPRNRRLRVARLHNRELDEVGKQNVVGSRPGHGYVRLGSLAGHGAGHGEVAPHAPRSRWWGLSVIGLTGALSTGAAFAVVTVAHRLPSVFVSLGVVAPCGLWLGHIRGEGG